MDGGQSPGICNLVTLKLPNVFEAVNRQFLKVANKGLIVF